jgi:hypothetical protein
MTMLKNPVILGVVVAAGVLLFLPTLDDGFMLDDYYQLAHLEDFDRVPEAGPLSLYTFADGRLNRLPPPQGDVLPWWSDDNLKINFFRPLSCVLHHVDHALYGRNPSGFHATNLLLWALVLMTVVLFYRKLGGPAVVLVAGLFYAMDEAHIINIQWVAARHGLLGVIFSVAALLQYHRWRSGGGRRALAGTLGLVLLGLLSSEVAVGAVFYVVAYEVCLAEGGVRSRLSAAVPVVALVFAYMIFYLLAGYGAKGSAWYISPVDRPLDFMIQAFGVRIPYLMMGALSTVPADLSLHPVARQAIWPLLMAWGLFAFFALLLLPHLLRDRFARFMALGGFLSLLPQMSGWPQDRLLILPTIGFAWVLGSAVVDYVGRFRKKQPRRWLLVIAAAIMVIVHGLVAPVQSVVFTNGYARWIRWMDDTTATAEMPGEEESPGARVLLLNGPEHGIYFPVIRWAQGRELPAGIWVISVVQGDHTLTRTGEKSFSLEADPPGFLSGPWELLLREDSNLDVGERFRRGVLEVEIAEVDDGQIRKIEVTVDLPLDSPDVWLLRWDGEGWVRVRAPAAGESVELIATKKS